MEGQPEDLRVWLETNYLGQFYDAIRNDGFLAVSDFAWCSQEDLREITNLVKMKRGERSRFLAAVSRVPGAIIATPKMVVIDKEESEKLNELRDLKIQAKKDLDEVARCSQDVAKSSQECHRQVLVVFEQLTALISNRKKVLSDAITSATRKKQATLKTRKKALEQLTRQFGDVEKACSKMLGDTDYSKLSTRKTQILEQVEKAAQKSKETGNLELTTLKFVTEKSEIEMAINDFGSLLGTKSAVPPKLTSITPSAKQVEIIWNPMSTYCEKFDVRFAVVEEKDPNMDSAIRQQFAGDKTDATLEVKPETQYAIQIRSQTAVGWGPYSDMKTFETRPGVLYLGFPGTTLLNAKDIYTLNEFLCELRATELLYKASVHGFASTDFHTHCDNKGATIVLIRRNGSPAIYGGYTPLNWEHTGGYREDAEYKSFIFTLSDPNGKPAKFQLSQNIQYTIRCQNSYGPTFGGAHNIYVANNCHTATGSYTNASSGSSYAVPDQNTLCGQYVNYTIEEVEVFLVR